MFQSQYCTVQHFYPRSPCGERLANDNYWSIIKSISIHALLAESDNDEYQKWTEAVKFLSTLSLRRATILISCVSHKSIISIHALLAESDHIF